VPLFRQDIDFDGGMPVPRVSRRGYSPEAGSQADPAGGTGPVQCGLKGAGSMHTLRTVVHEIMFAERGIMRRAACVLLWYGFGGIRKLRPINGLPVVLETTPWPDLPVAMIGAESA